MWRETVKYFFRNPKYSTFQITPIYLWTQGILKSWCGTSAPYVCVCVCVIEGINTIVIVQNQLNNAFSMTENKAVYKIALL